jgi:hypothetical protein
VQVLEVRPDLFPNCIRVRGCLSRDSVPFALGALRMELDTAGVVARAAT